MFMWTDYTIVLGWLNTALNLVKTFVRNKVTEIQRCEDWRHINTDALTNLVWYGINIAVDDK